MVTYNQTASQRRAFDKPYAWFIALALLAIFFTGCTAAATPALEQSAAPVAPSSRPPAGQSEFAQFPILPVTGEKASAPIRWQEPYPQVVQHGDVIARFPGTVDGLVLADGEGDGLRINARYRTLEWDGIRTRGERSVIVRDGDGAVRHQFMLDIQPSPFLIDAFAATAGDSATLERWWAGWHDESYFYLGGTNTARQLLHYQLIFAYPRDEASGSSVDDYAILRARTLTSGALHVVSGTVAKNGYRTVDTSAIEAALVRDEARLCAPPSDNRNPDYNHNFVVTRAYTNVQPENGNPERVRALNGSQHFLLLAPAHQRTCFKRSHLFEVLPKEKPTTTAADRARLPSGTRYAHQQYELVYKEEFSSSTTLEKLREEGYRVFLTDETASDYRTTTTTLDDPVKIENGMLHLGHGVSAANGQQCRENTIDVLDRSKCSIVSAIESFSIPYRFKYGLLEVDFAHTVVQVHTRMYMWLHSHPLWYGYGWPKPRGIYAGPEFIPGTAIGIRNVFHHADSYEWESQFWGSEFELLETSRINDTKLGYWIVNYFGKDFNFPSNNYFLYTINEYDGTKRLRYAVEWTPEGYLIWLDEDNGEYQSVSRNSSGEPLRFGTRSGASCHKETGGGLPKTIDGVQNIIPCGINHTPMQLQINPLASGKSLLPRLVGIKPFTPEPKWRYVAVDSIRLYKPKNNYADIDPVYE